MTIHPRHRYFIISGFVGLSLLIIVITVLGISRVDNIVSSYDDIVKRHNLQKDFVTTMRLAARERSIMVWRSTLTNDPFIRSQYLDDYLQFGTQFLIARDKFRATQLSEKERQLLDQIQLSINEATPIFRNAMEKMVNTNPAITFNESINRGLPAQQRVITLLDELHLLQTHESQHIYAGITTELSSTLVTLLLLLSVTLLSGSVFAAILVRYFRNMLTTITKSKNELKLINDELEIRVDHRTQQLKVANQHLETLANYDALTGLSNRMMFSNQLELIFNRAKRDNEKFAVLFIDLDGFKEINDTHGHDAGDTILTAVAQRIKETIRESDLAARLGGDEFVIVLANITAASDAQAIKQQIQEKILLPVPYSGTSLQINASIGFSSYPEDGDTTALVLKAADRSMYDAKRTFK